MHKIETAYRLYVGAILVTGVGALTYLTRALQSAELNSELQPILVLWVAMITVAAMSPIPMPRGKAQVHLTTALDFAALLVFGTVLACWVGVLSRLVSAASEKWNPFPTNLVRLGKAILSIGAAGTVYEVFGGHVGESLELSAGTALALAAAAATYGSVRWIIGSVHELLLAPGGWRNLWTNYLSAAMMGDLAVLPFGLLLALTQVRVGTVGVALFLIPLLLARYIFKMWIDTKRAHIDTVRTLMSAVDAADPHTWGHSYRISKMSLRVGRYLGMPDAALEELEYAGLLHDIGRTAIKREILLKTGKLTEKEQTILRTHPRIGYEMLSRLKFFRGAADIVHAHHEQPDGKGYPRGIHGDAVPLGSRIIMAVAAFDAMTSDRPYRRGLTPDAAFEELLDHTGTQFYPEVVEALIYLYSNNLLFQDFEDSVLARYAEGQGNSRSLDEYLRRVGMKAEVPEKRGLDTGSFNSIPEGVPVLDLDDLEMEGESMERSIYLDARGKSKLLVAARSDQGCVRGNNEDTFGVFDSEDPTRGCLLVVADGMGGAAAGEVASKLAVETIHAAYFGECGRRKPTDAIRFAVELANRTIFSRSSSEAPLGGMGTTCTAAAIVGRNLHLGHVGDTRAYLVRANVIEILTEDHTLAAELVSFGQAVGQGPVNANHVLTRSLGSQAEVEVDVAERPYRLGDGEALVLCSDGLTNLVSEDEIHGVVTADLPGNACRTLVDLARSRGGPDNVTVLIAKIEIG